VFILSLLSKSSPYSKYIAAGLVSLIVMSFFSLGINSTLFQGNAFQNVQHAEFNGTVYPYKAVPNWSKLSDAQRLMTYDQLPKDLLLDPLAYKASDLAKSFDEIGYGSSSDTLRNEKITYSVPYMGNYKLDGKENVGSHAAVDIKLPIGTPILSIANGVVIKVDDQPSGFGKHIVIRHSDAPAFNGAGEATYFSSYSHMSEMQVTAGSIVTKGQQIGLVGDSGTATTPHIHFQIDTVDAPFHPYWPFSGAEAQAAGLSFFEALNSGLGKENALARTVHPLEYVQKYLNNSNPATEQEFIEEDSSNEAENGNEGKNEDQGQNDGLSSSTEIVIGSSESNLGTNSEPDEIVLPEGKVSIEAPKEMVYGQTYQVKVKYDSENGSLLAGLNPDEFTFTPSLMASFVVPRSTSFENDEVLVPFTPKQLGTLSLKVKIGAQKAYASDIQVKLFSDIESDDVDFEAFQSLKNSGIINGYSDGSFAPEKNVSRVEALKLLSFAVSAKDMYLEDLPFSDIEPESWYEIYLRKAASLGAVDLAKTEFSPNKDVNRAEFLKMLFESSNEDLGQFAGAEWYDSYMKAAEAKGLIAAGSDPAESLNRRQIAKLVYNFLALK